MEVWFSPSCSTCRSARSQLEGAGVLTGSAGSSTSRRVARDDRTPDAVVAAARG